MVPFEFSHGLEFGKSIGGYKRMHLKFFDLVSVRIEDGSSNIINFIEHEYDYLKVAETIDSADIVISFAQDKFDVSRSIHIRAPVAYDDQGVVLRDPQNHVMRIDYYNIGSKKCRVICDKNFNPHFFAIIMECLIHFNLLKKDTILCHSSAFQVNGKTVLCPAWRNVGKTNVLLSFLLNGANFIEDDWCAVQNNGTVYSLPKRLNLLYYNFIEYPELLKYSSSEFTALVSFVKQARNGAYDLDCETINVLSDQARMRMSPYEVFKQAPNTDPLQIDYVFLLSRTTDESGLIKVERIDRNALIHILYSIIDFEQTHFRLAYSVNKARTGRANRLLEEEKDITFRIMHEAFKKVANIYQVTVPAQHRANEVALQIQSVIDTTK